MLVETPDLENMKPPDWLMGEIAMGTVVWDSRYEGQLLLVRVCHTCQCAQTSCICDAPVIDAIPIWRQRQGTNEKLRKYLKSKKAVHAAERSLPTFKLHTPEEMKGRMTLWLPVKGMPSQHPAAVYMRKLFAEGDRVLLQLIHSTETWIKRDDIYYTSRDARTYRARTGQTLLVNKDTEGKFYIGEVGVKENLVTPQASTEKHPRSLADATDEVFIQTLKDKNEDGWNIYVTMNPIHAESKTRRKGDIADIRSVYCEVDENGEECIQAIRASVGAGEIPRPSIVLESSPGKYQVIWFVKYFTAPAQEALNKALQMKFKTDPKSVDCSRVLRLPNFYNKKPKYATPPLVSVFSKSPSTERYSPSDFKIDTEEKSAAPIGSAAAPEIIKEICSELEKGLTEANLEPRGAVTRGEWIYQFSFVCPNPQHTTVDRIRSVSVRVDGMIGSNCYHTNCDGKDWKKWMRPWLEEAIGRKLRFPPPQEQPKHQTERSKEADNSTCLILESAEDIALARTLGFDAESQNYPYSELFAKYSHICLCGKSTKITGWMDAAKEMAKKCPTIYSGQGVEYIPLPVDLTAAPEIRWGSKKYPPHKSLVDAATQYSAEDLKKHFTRILASEAFRQSSTRLVKIVETDEEELLEYDMTEEEIAEERKKPHPVLRFKEGPGPHFDESILYGPAGEVVKLISKYNESDTSAIYLNLLVSLGNLFGRHAYFNVNKTQHFTNEFVACVGDSAITRKGTGADEVDALLNLLAPGWMKNCNKGGLRSSQAIVDQIRDDSSFQSPIKMKGTVVGYKEVTKKGVADKRLVIREDEISILLKLMADTKNTADETIRKAWDGKKLRNIVMGKVDNTGEPNTIICSEPMVSVVGYTTSSIVKASLPVGSDLSGSGNRFLWCLMKQLKEVPRGGPDIDWTTQTMKRKRGGKEVLTTIYFQEVISHASQDIHIPIAAEAASLWDRTYTRLRRIVPRTYAQRMNSRAAAHIRRLATILCLIDCEDAVKLDHLKAALSLWDYCAESTSVIFQGYSAEQAKILRRAKEVKDVGMQEVHDLFHRHKSVEWREAQLRGLVTGGYLSQAGDRWKFKHF